MFDAKLDKAKLDQAYRGTEYWVATRPPIRVRIGVAQPAICDLHQAHGVDCSTVITAHNPKSQQHSALANQRAHAELTQALEQAGYRKISATGQHPDGSWPAEEGWLVLGMDVAEASLWAEQFEQFAVVCLDAHGVPNLQWFA